MSNVTPNRKISGFLAQTAIPSDAQFTFVSAGVNYRILLSDFQSSLGVTGTIEQSGSATATPVLNVAGAVNKIRNIENGYGVKASVSPENGITLDHNFQRDTTGVPIVDSLDQTSPKFRSLVAGSGVNVSSSNGTIQIALAATPASTKTVVVNSLTDFPSPVAGVITLADNTEYAVRNDITTSSRFVLGNNCVISGSDEAVTALTYTGVGTMFTAVNATCKARNITTVSATGAFIDFSGTGIELLQVIDCHVITDTLGTVGGVGGVQLSGSQFEVSTNGMTFTGANGVVLAGSFLCNVDAGTAFDLGAATFSAVSFNEGFVSIGAGAVFLDGAAASANIDSGGLGTVHNCRFSGAGTPVQTITSSDIRWQFLINDEIVDTHKDCAVYQAGNAVPTTISVASTPVKLAGAWVQSHASQFTSDASGRMTYIGVKNTHFTISFAITAAPVSGTNKIISFYVAVNGVVIPGSKSPSIISSGSDRRIPVIWRSILAQGDYVEVFVSNDTDTVDVLATDAVLSIVQ